MAVGNMVAIKRYMERADEIAPEGGRQCKMDELKEFKASCQEAELDKLGDEARELLK